MKLLISLLLTLGLCPCRVLSAAQDGRLQSYYCDEINKPFFAEKPGEKGRFTAQRQNALPDTFLMPKPPGIKRVFILGESVANILGPGKALSGKKTAGQKLLGKLTGDEAAADNPGIEIINCGMGGYESYRIYGVLQEILKYSPDLVVTLSGNNDNKEESCPGLEFDLQRRKLKLLENYFSLAAARPKARKEAFLKSHEAMLARMAGSARKAGVPIVFCTLPAAVKDMPPRQPLPFGNKDFDPGYGFFYTKRYEEALKSFKLALAADPRGPLLNFYAAKTLEGLDRDKEAAAHYAKALDFDTTMSRSGRERNDVIRRAAAAEGACLADLESLFQRLSPDGLPGFTEFTDGMHWNYSYNKDVWEEIFRSAGRCGLKGYEKFTAGNPGSWAETPRETSLKRLSYAFAWINDKDFNEASLAALSRISEDQPELLKKAGTSAGQLEKLLLKDFLGAEKTKPLTELYPFFLAHLAETERRAGNYATALSLYDKALSLEPGNHFLKSARARDPAAIEDKQGGLPPVNRKPEPRRSAPAAAFPRAPERASGKDAASSKKLADQAAGKVLGNDPAAAEELYERALKLNAFNAEALMSLCSLHLKKGKIPQALEACQRAAAAAYQDPANNTPPLKMLSCEAAFESYKLLKNLKRIPEAVDVLGKCVKEAPADWPGLAAANAALKDTPR